MDRGSFVLLEPWDILRGLDVFRDTAKLDAECGRASLVHFAPNCATFSRAREIPMKGVKNPPQPLRSEEEPRGISSALSHMSKRARLRLEKDTHMAEDSATRCLTALEQGRKFSLEHPGRSLALELPSWKDLVRARGVFVTRYHTCMFEGSRRRKAQVLIHNVPELELMGRVCNEYSRCARTGLPHEKWRPIVSGGKVAQFITGEEREYPKGFCDEYARLLPPLGSFLEVYSGPNAPLSDGVSRSRGGPGVAGRGDSSKLSEGQDLEHARRMRRAPMFQTPSQGEYPRCEEHLQPGHRHGTTRWR